MKSDASLPEEYLHAIVILVQKPATASCTVDSLRIVLLVQEGTASMLINDSHCMSISLGVREWSSYHVVLQ